MRINNLNIGIRLGAGFATLILLLIITGFLGGSKLSSLNDNMSSVVNRSYPQTVYANDIIDQENLIIRTFNNLFLMSKQEQIKAQRALLPAAFKSVAANMVRLDKAIVSAEGRTYYRAIQVARNNYVVASDQVLQLIDAGKREQALRLLFDGDTFDLQQKYLQTLTALISYQDQQMTAAGDDVAAQYMNGRNLIAALTGIAILFAIAIAIFITRSITLPLNHAIGIAETVAAGDLTSHISIRTGKQDETGKLLLALHTMNTRLQKIVGEVRVSTDTIATASSEIASGNLDLSSRTEQQAGSLEETATAMEELTATVRQNADNARQANQLAASASQIAVQGGDVVGQVVNTMNNINDSSKKIVDIISVIDGIAFQTNILALNAAVEAARAGEQGRGFAVVASEVRSLAQRSASAAKEIKELIDDSVEKVEQGSRLVGQAGVTMGEVVTSVRQVTDVMAEISSANQEQSEGIEKINQAIAQMEQSTQQNAALVEQAAAASQSLQDQAGHLTTAISVFKLPADHTRSTPLPSTMKTGTQTVAVRQDKTPAARKTGRTEPGKPAASEWGQF